MTEQEKLEILIDKFMQLKQNGKNSMGELIQKLANLHRAKTAAILGGTPIGQN